jgi:ADP-ribose pyrophosphatase YjhB (NUDIX family)
MNHTDSIDDTFWRSLDHLLARFTLRVDRPAGSAHQHYPDLIYPLDYGYLEGTRSADGGGIDVWVGSLPEKRVTAIICTVDLNKHDAELKLLVGCTQPEMRSALRLHNEGGQAGMLVVRPDPAEQGPLDWARRLQAIAQNGLTYASNPYDIERYEATLQIAAEIASAYTGTPVRQVLAEFEAQAGHATPKVDVRAAVFRDDAILLVKERVDGKWTVPGGWAEVNESPGEAVVKEVYEESGYRVRATKLLAVYDRNKSRHGHPPHPFHVYKLFFLCEIVGGSPKESIETEGVGFFRRDELPELSQGRVTPSQIDRLFEHYHHPEWPTDFD